MVREWLKKKLRKFHIQSIQIERTRGTFHIIIKTSRPGLLIGRSGEGIEKLKKEIDQRILKIHKRFVKAVSDKKNLPEKKELKITVEEVRAPETHAALVSHMIAEDLEKRIPFRRVVKQVLDKVASTKDVKGVKIVVSGRLDGAEIARREWLKKGRIPLQTIRANIDFAQDEAYTTYGTVGIKVWIYKGDVFNSSI